LGHPHVKRSKKGKEIIIENTKRVLRMGKNLRFKVFFNEGAFLEIMFPRRPPHQLRFLDMVLVKKESLLGKCE